MTGFNRVFKVGTRKSPLAQAQTAEVVAALKKKFSTLRLKVIAVSTFGDEFQSVEIFKLAGEGVFTKAIEKKLLDGTIDLAVHSLKDLPTLLPAGLKLAATLRRADTADVLVTKKKHSLESLPVGSRVGTGSLRRREQLKRLRPDLKIEALRGNLGTRIDRVLRHKRLDAVLIARAGVLRLKRYLKFIYRIPVEKMLPAVGQGAIALQARSSDKESLRIAATVNHRPTELAVRAERAFLSALRGGCRVPIGVLTKLMNGQIRIKGAVFSVKDERYLSALCRGSAEAPEKVGRALAKKLIQKGAAKLLKHARHQSVGGRARL